MDAGPRNLIINSDGELALIDYEHASGCAAEWDVERVIFQLPEHLKDTFEKNYYQGKQRNDLVSKITKLVMLSTFKIQLRRR